MTSKSASVQTFFSMATAFSSRAPGSVGCADPSDTRHRSWDGASERAHAGGEVDRPRARVLQRPPHVGQIEVLDRDLPAVVESIEPAEHGGKVDVARRIVDVELRV